MKSMYRCSEPELQKPVPDSLEKLKKGVVVNQRPEMDDYTRMITGVDICRQDDHSFA
jgi:hypothetical protein